MRVKYKLKYMTDGYLAIRVWFRGVKIRTDVERTPQKIAKRLFCCVQWNRLRLEPRNHIRIAIVQSFIDSQKINCNLGW